MSSTKKKRSTNFSTNEEHLLVSLVHDFKNIIECKKSGHTTWQQKNEAWKKLQEQFNARNNGQFRDIETIKQKYQNLKKNAKQKFSTNKRSFLQTGGGPGNVLDISDIDSSIKDILGDQIGGLPALCDSDATVVPEDLSDELATEEMEEVGNVDDGENVLEEILLIHEDPPHMDNPRTLRNQSGDRVRKRSTQPSHTQADNEETTHTTWATYNSTMLQEPVNKKLKTDIPHGAQSKRLAFKKNLNENLLQEKLAFVELQKKMLGKEHKLKMKILSYEYFIKKTKAESIGLGVEDEELSDESDFED